MNNERELLWIELPLKDVLDSLAIKGVIPDSYGEREIKVINYNEKYHTSKISISTKKVVATYKEQL